MNVFENPAILGTVWLSGYPVYAVPPIQSPKLHLDSLKLPYISTDFVIEFNNWLKETFGMKHNELIEDYVAVYVKDKNAFLVNKFTYNQILRRGNAIDLKIMNKSAMN